MEKQILGSEAPIAHKGQSMVQDGQRGGTAQICGDEAPTSRTPISEGNFFRKSIEIQGKGSEAPLNTTAHHGWESAPTPMSTRTGAAGSK